MLLFFIKKRVNIVYSISYLSSVYIDNDALDSVDILCVRLVINLQSILFVKIIIYLVYYDNKTLLSL